MSQLHVNEDENAKKRNVATSPSSHLKIKKDSHSIRKSPRSSSPSSQSSTRALPRQSSPSSQASTRALPRHPMIIYTHSPKVIHTNPKDFMALVQKLTGLPRSRSEENNAPTKPKLDKIERNIPMRSPFIINDNNECSSMITNDGYGYFAPEFYDPIPSASFESMTFYNNNMSSMDFLGSNTPYYNYSNSLLLMSNMKSSFSSPMPGSLQEFSEF